MLNPSKQIIKKQRKMQLSACPKTDANGRRVSIIPSLLIGRKEGSPLPPQWTGPRQPKDADGSIQKVRSRCRKQAPPS